MRLTDAQIAEFDREGWLFFPEAFNPEEVKLLEDEAKAIFKMDREEVWREKSGVARTAFAAHTLASAAQIRSWLNAPLRPPGRGTSIIFLTAWTGPASAAAHFHLS